MRVVVAGGHGQVALRLERLLARRGDEVAGIVRTPQHSVDLLAAGAEAVVCDLESASVEDIARHLEGIDAAVFAARAGPGSGIDRKDSVDRAAASLFADAAEAAGVRRVLVVSAMGVDREPPVGTDPVFAAYLRAKGAADADVRSRAGLEWTILRPGRLTDESGTGLRRLARDTGNTAGRCYGIGLVLDEDLDFLGPSLPSALIVIKLNSRNARARDHGMITSVTEPSSPPCVTGSPGHPMSGCCRVPLQFGG